MEAPVYHLEGVVRDKADTTSDFSGPLDLILFLLSKNKMEIRDIQLSVILAQYLDWMRQRRELDLDVASEFVAMASHLVYIKTRMLLTVGDEDVLSEMDQLIADLEERRRSENLEQIRLVLPKLEARYLVGSGYIARQSEQIKVDRTYRYVHSPADLRRAMQDVLERNGRKLPPPLTAFSGIVGREPYSVTDKASEILQTLIRAGIMRFRAMFRGSRSRSEVVATFIAILELCKARRIRLAGTEADCTVTRLEGEPEDETLVGETY